MRHTRPEPDFWTVTVVDTSISEGFMGFGGVAATGNTNVSPQSRFDDVAVLNPQVFTISHRSVNGIVKAHDADSFVQVVDKFYAARG